MRSEAVWRTPEQLAERKYQDDALRAENLARLSRSLAALRRELASVQTELLARKAGFNPDQPRVPAGNPDGGQWTDGGGTSEGNDGDSAVSVTFVAPGLVLNDATPDPITAWARYAQGSDKTQRDATAVERTSTILHDTLTRVSSTVARRPDSSAANYGTDVHTAFARVLRDLNLPGIGSRGIEQSFDANGQTRYGKDGSIRTDVVLRNEEDEIIAIYDLKTGNAIIGPSRARELRDKTGAGPDVPVIEMHSLRGPVRR